MSDPDPITEDLLGALSVALKARDLKGAVAIIRMIALHDPDLAASLLAVVNAA